MTMITVAPRARSYAVGLMRERNDNARDAFGSRVETRPEIAKRLWHHASDALVILLFLAIVALWIVAALNGEELPG